MYSTMIHRQLSRLIPKPFFNCNAYPTRFSSSLFLSPIRLYTNKTRPQNPEDVDNMPIYQFASDKSRKRNIVFTWGFSATGALGHETFMVQYKKNDTIPFLRKSLRKSPQKLRFVTLDTKVYDAAAGSGFTVLAATVDNTNHVLFGCGLNTDSQIGYQESTPNKPLICVGNLSPIRIPIDIDNPNSKVRISKVACGRGHTVCLTNKGKIYTLGNNSFGQCGRKIIKNEKYFASRRIHEVVLDINSDERVIDIVCGQDHTLFLTDSGSVYSCGWGADGQLGNGSFKSVGIPTKVIGDIQGEKIVAISSASDCVLALNDKGQVFGWGNSEYNQLRMVTSETQVNISRHLNLENKLGKVSCVASGGSMCGIVNDSGTAFVWGYGILGFGPNVNELKYPAPLNVNLFGRTPFNNDIKVSQLVAGLHNFAAITNKGELYMWGQNNKANLGIGHEADMMFPYRVSIPCVVQKVSLGPDHTIAMGKTL